MNNQAAFSIRNLQKEEVERFKSLRLHALTEAPYAFEQAYEEEVKRAFSDWEEMLATLCPPATHTMLIAEKEGQVVGSVYGFNRGEGVGSFGGMWVSIGYRQQGVASALIRAIFSWAKEAGISELKIWNVATNHPAQQLYEKHGFRETGEKKRLASGKTILRLHVPLLLSAKQEENSAE